MFIFPAVKMSNLVQILETLLTINLRDCNKKHVFWLCKKRSQYSISAPLIQYQRGTNCNTMTAQQLNSYYNIYDGFHIHLQKNKKLQKHIKVLFAFIYMKDP